MGVDVRIRLNPGATIQDVARVLCKLCGAEEEAFEIKGHDRIPCADILISVSDMTGPARQWHEASFGSRTLSVLYNYEFLDGHRMHRGHHGMTPLSTAFWIAAGKRLVQFFGGQIDYNDSDDVSCDYRAHSLPYIGAEDGNPFDRLTVAIRAVKPLTQKDLDWAEQYAAYPREGRK